MNKSFVIYFNPECSKCQTALQTLEARGNTCSLIEYLDNPPTAEDLKAILKKLDKKPLDIIRKGEMLFLDEYAQKTLSDDEWIQIIVDHPVLLQRPIVVRGDKAWIARSEEVLDEIK